MYCRPILCRICQCPVADTGVRVDELDLKKLGSWWVQQERLPKIELDDVADFLESQICQFCLWDARSTGEAEIEVEEFDWWTGHDTNKLFEEFYYNDAMMQPCSVKLVSRNISIKRRCPRIYRRPVPRYLQTSMGQIPSVYKCSYCWKSFGPSSSIYQRLLAGFKPIKSLLCGACVTGLKNTVQKYESNPMVCKDLKCHMCQLICTDLLHLLTHFVTEHSNDRTNPKSLHCCLKIFKDVAEFCTHIVHVEKDKYCLYCPKYYSTISQLNFHIKTTHKLRAIKCKYPACSKFFTSDEEMEKHVARIHENNAIFLKQCPHCPCKFKKTELMRHLRYFHKMMRCGVRSCEFFYVKQVELENHILKAHAMIEEFTCDYCKKQYISKFSLWSHEKRCSQGPDWENSVVNSVKLILSDSQEVVPIELTNVAKPGAP